MSRENKIEQYESLKTSVPDFIDTVDEYNRSYWLEFDISEPQAIGPNKQSLYTERLHGVIVNSDDYSLGNLQEQAPVKFNFTSMPENFTLPVTYRVIANKADTTPQTFVEVVELLINTVMDNLKQSISSLADEDIERLTQALDSLIHTAGEEENLLLTTLINFVRNLINISNDDNLSSDLPPQETNSMSLRPHRHENVGRPASLPV